jgi:hypothetical protein
MSVFHVHPEGCLGPSETDRQAARELLTDPDTGLEGRLLLPISARTRTGVETRFFVAEGPDATIRRTNPAIIGRVERRAGVLPGDDDWGAAFLDALHAARCARRLREEVEILRAEGFEVQNRGLRGGYRLLRLERNARALWLAVPNEFPFAPPRVFSENGDTLFDVSTSGLRSVIGWSSASDLLTLACEAEASVQTQRDAESPIVRPANVPIILPGALERAPTLAFGITRNHGAT